MEESNYLHVTKKILYTILTLLHVHARAHHYGPLSANSQSEHLHPSLPVADMVLCHYNQWSSVLTALQSITQVYKEIFFFCNTNKTVSYTHLDVYKRQIYNLSADNVLSTILFLYIFFIKNMSLNRKEILYYYSTFYY